MPPLRMMVLPAADVEIVDTWTVSGSVRHGQSRLHDRRRVRPRRAHVQRVRGGWARRTARADPGAVASRRWSSPTSRSGSPRARSAEITTPGHRQGADVRRRDVGGEPAVPIPARRGRRPPPRRRRAARRRRRVDLGDRGRRRGVHARAAGKDPSDRHVGDDGGGQRSSTSPTRPEAAPRCTRAVRCSGDCATSHAITQHFAVKPDTFTLAGAVLAGQDVDLSFL